MPTPEEIDRIKKMMVGLNQIAAQTKPETSSGEDDGLTQRIAFILGASPGVDLIAKERFRQINEEGFEPAHDDGHTGDELIDAAMCYLDPSDEVIWGMRWPWNERWWKPKDRLRNLVRAGALIAAEIDRLKRVEEESEAETLPNPGAPGWMGDYGGTPFGPSDI